MPFIPYNPANNTPGNQDFQRGWNMIMTLYGQRAIAEREQRLKDTFKQEMDLREKTYQAQEKLRDFQLKEAEQKAKAWDQQQKNIEAYKSERQKLKDAGKLTPKADLELTRKYQSGIPSLKDISSSYEIKETPEEKRAAELKQKEEEAKIRGKYTKLTLYNPNTNTERTFTSEPEADDFLAANAVTGWTPEKPADWGQKKGMTPQEQMDLYKQKKDYDLMISKQIEDYKQVNKTPSTPYQWYFQKNKGKPLTEDQVAEFDKKLKSEGQPTPFKTFYNDESAKGLSPGEIVAKWHQQRKEDQIEVANARYPTRQQIPDLPGYVYDRRSGKYYTPAGDEVAPEDFGQLWAGKYQMVADKSALREITKRNELVKSFAKRIETNSPIVMELAKKVGNKDTRLLNVPINDLWKQKIIGDGDLAAYKLALTSLSNEVAKVESSSLGISGVSVEQMQIMGQIHDLNLPIAATQKVIDLGMRLSHTLENALEDQRKEVLNRISNWSPEEKEAAAGKKSRYKILEVK